MSHFFLFQSLLFHFFITVLYCLNQEKLIAYNHIKLSSFLRSLSSAEGTKNGGLISNAPLKNLFTASLWCYHLRLFLIAIGEIPVLPFFCVLRDASCRFLLTEISTVSVQRFGFCVPNRCICLITHGQFSISPSGVWYGNFFRRFFRCDFSTKLNGNLCFQLIFSLLLRVPVSFGWYTGFSFFFAITMLSVK